MHGYGLRGQVHAGPLGRYEAGMALRRDARGFLDGLHMWTDVRRGAGDINLGTLGGLTLGPPDPSLQGFQFVPPAPPAPGGGFGLGINDLGMPPGQVPPDPSPPALAPPSPMPQAAPAGAVFPVPVTCSVMGVPCWMVGLGAVAVGAVLLLRKKKHRG